MRGLTKMRKTIFISTLILLLLGSVSAVAGDGPFLVCDPMSDVNVTHFEISFNGEIVDSQKYYVNSTHFKIRHSISDLAPGDYTVKARSANEEWDKVSEWSNTINFTVPSSREMPSCGNLRMK
jgi:hypothetical protein